MTGGTFLDAAIDQGVSIPSASSGSVQVSPSVDTTYWLYVITQEGGIAESVVSGQPVLSVPSSIDLVAGLNHPVTQHGIEIQNVGGGTLQWTASAASTPSTLITINTASGQTAPSVPGEIAFTLNVSSLSPGMYYGTISVNAGTGGSASVAVHVRLVNILYIIDLPLTFR